SPRWGAQAHAEQEKRSPLLEPAPVGYAGVVDPRPPLEEASMQRTRPFLALALLALPASAAAPPRVALTDIHGDPLPPGAVGRFGARPLRHEGRVAHLGFSPDGKRLLSAGASGVVRVWESSTGRWLRQAALPGAADPFRLLPDGRTVAVV